jgi:DNA invertase Pin-like site-specific DNA recombinase
VYLRVSTDAQSTDNQRPDVERIVHARGLELVAVYEERASSARSRPEFDRMLEDARRGVFRVLVVWAIDRFGRSLGGNVAAVLELDRIGVELVSVREPWLETGGPVRSLLVAIFSWVAEQERARLGERTRAGLERARARGVRLGRPKARFNPRMVRELRAEGYTVPAIAATMQARGMRVSESTIRRALR